MKDVMTDEQSRGEQREESRGEVSGVKDHTGIDNRQ
jgi:hypothetical protein